MKPSNAIPKSNSSVVDHSTINALPDELVAHILVKSRVGVLELMAGALTSKRFLSFTQPVLVTCKRLSAELLQLDPKHVWEMFQNLPGLQRMLAGLALNQVLSERGRIRNATLQPDQLNALHAGFKVNGLKRLSLCADTAPKESMQLALACLPASRKLVPSAFGELLSALRIALEVAPDDQTRFDLICLIKTVYCIVPAGSINNAYRALEKFNDKKMQLAALCALLGITERSGSHIITVQPEVTTCVMKILGDRITDGTLFAHPAHDQVIKLCVVSYLPHLQAEQMGQWLTKAVGTNLCSAISQYGKAKSWTETPWPLLLVGRIYACTDAELDRESLSKLIGTALKSGGWTLVTELEYIDLDQRLRFAADPMRGLEEWISERSLEDSDSDDSNCTIC
jgi:hypothetical protein